jgi:hypothetical protein
MEITKTSGRHFSGIVGLRPGYSSEIPAFTREDILNSWHQWVQDRHSSKLCYLGIIAGQVESILYAFEKNGQLLRYSEPVIRVYGEIPSHQEDIDDEGILETLTSLFAHLGEQTRQTTVRFTFFGNENPRTSYRIRLPDTPHPLDS